MLPPTETFFVNVNLGTDVFPDDPALMQTMSLTFANVTTVVPGTNEDQV